MNTKIQIIFGQKSANLTFLDSQSQKKIKVKIPIFTICFQKNIPKYLNFNLKFILKLSYFENFIYWLIEQNLLLEKQIFQQKMLKNKVFCLKMVNNFHLLFWKYSFKDIIIFIENDENFASWFKQNFHLFKLEIKKYQKLFLTTTDTVPGIASFYKNCDLDAIFVIKKRDFSKKIVTLVANLEQIKPLIKQENYKKLKKITRKIWPGATTLIIENQSFRIPNQVKLLKLLKKKGPAFVTSANISNEKPLDLVAAKRKFWQITKIFNFGPGTGKVSRIFDLDNKKWIRK